MFSKFSFFRSNISDNTHEKSISDNVLKHCPECGDEYRPEFSHCALCQVPLVSVDKEKNNQLQNDKKKSNRNLQISPDDELVTMRRGNLLEMKDIQRLLQKEIIGSLLVEDRSDCNKGCCNSKIFDLRVKKDVAHEAQQILAEDFKRTTALDSHDFQEEVEVVFDQRSARARCPACGCQFQTEDRTCPECGLCF